MMAEECGDRTAGKSAAASSLHLSIVPLLSLPFEMEKGTSPINSFGGRAESD